MTFKHDNTKIVFRKRNKSLIVIFKWAKLRYKYKFKANQSQMYDVELFMIDWSNKWDSMSALQKEIAVNELVKELER